MAVVFAVISTPAYAQEEPVPTQDEEKPRIRDRAADLARKAGQGIANTASAIADDPKGFYKKKKEQVIDLKNKGVKLAKDAKETAINVKEGVVEGVQASAYFWDVVKTPSKWILCKNWRDQLAFLSLLLIGIYWFSRNKKSVAKDGSKFFVAIGVLIFAFLASRGLILLKEIAENVWWAGPSNPDEVKAGAVMITEYAASPIPIIIKWLPAVIPGIILMNFRWILDAVTAIKYEGFKGLLNHLRNLTSDNSGWIECASLTCDCKNPPGYNYCGRCRTLSPNADLSELLAKLPKKGSGSSDKRSSLGWEL